MSVMIGDNSRPWRSTVEESHQWDTLASFLTLKKRVQQHAKYHAMQVVMLLRMLKNVADDSVSMHTIVTSLFSNDPILYKASQANAIIQLLAEIWDQAQLLSEQASAPSVEAMAKEKADLEVRLVESKKARAELEELLVNAKKDARFLEDEAKILHQAAQEKDDVLKGALGALEEEKKALEGSWKQVQILADHLKKMLSRDDVRWGVLEGMHLHDPATTLKFCQG